MNIGLYSDSNCSELNAIALLIMLFMSLISELKIIRKQPSTTSIMKGIPVLILLCETPKISFRMMTLLDENVDVHFK